MSNIIQLGGKFYDFGTKNQSFLLTAHELKTLGIKNFYFMLEVKYPQLGVQDIDPYNPNISQEDIGKIIIECKANPWFFFREVAKVPAQGAPIPFQTNLHRSACAMVWCFDHSIDFMVDQPRQTFKTTWALLITEYAFIFELKNANIPFMHLNEQQVMRNLEMFRDYVCVLPPYLNPWLNKRKLPGLQSIKYEEHSVNIKHLTQADSDVKAKDKLRGWTLFVGLIDEWEYIKFISDVIAGAAPAIISGRVIAEQTGCRTCMMYLSTPGDLETDEGKAAQHMIDSTHKFFEGLYDMSEADLLAFLSGMNKRDDGDNTVVDNSDQSKVTMLYIEFNYKQLRKTDAWLREQYLEAERTGKIAEYRRGVLLDRFRGGDVVLFRQADIDYIKSHIRQPDHDMFILNKFHLYVFDHPIFQSDLMSDTPYFDIFTPYLIGVDISSGGGGRNDNTAIVVVHPYTLEVVAEMQSPYIGIIDLMRIITLLARLIPKGIFCVETNNVGKAIVDFVQESQLEHRFYHDPEANMLRNATTKQQDMSKMLEAKAKAKQYIGLYVTPQVRDEMFNLLKVHVKDYRDLIFTPNLVRDITNLVVVKKKIQASSGEHDDTVMAYLHTLFILYYGFDLSRFGIDKSRCAFRKPIEEALADYEKEMAMNTVDNMVPYEHPTLYEEQLLSELTGTSDIPKVSNMVGRDVYGYTASDYIKNTPEAKQQIQESPDVSMDKSDYMFLNEVNTFF